jgi:hypothetical protein
VRYSNFSHLGQVSRSRHSDLIRLAKLDDQGYVHKVALNDPLGESNIISTINIHYADIFGDTGIVPNATWSLLVVRKKDVGRQGWYFLKPVADGKKDPETFLKCVYFYLDVFPVLISFVFMLDVSLTVVSVRPLRLTQGLYTLLLGLITQICPLLEVI